MGFRYATGRLFKPRAVDASWWLSGGISATNAIAVYQPKGAADYATSLVNLANPGTYNATDVGGTAVPTWATATGWTFDGTNDYLKTNYVPSAGANLSVFIYAEPGIKTDVRTLIGQHAAGSPFNGVFVRMRVPATGVLYANDGNSGQEVANVYRTGYHVAGVAGRQGYYDGATDRASFADSVQAFSAYDLVIGALQYSSIIQFSDCIVVAVAIYNTVITGTQVAALTTAMNAL